MSVVKNFHVGARSKYAGVDIFPRDITRGEGRRRGVTRCSHGLTLHTHTHTHARHHVGAIALPRHDGNFAGFFLRSSSDKSRNATLNVEPKSPSDSGKGTYLMGRGCPGMISRDVKRDRRVVSSPFRSYICIMHSSYPDDACFHYP